MSAEEAAFYRQRAKDMRKQSARAQTRELQDSYLAIAADWDRLAKQLDEMKDAGPAVSPASPPAQDSINPSKQ